MKSLFTKTKAAIIAGALILAAPVTQANAATFNDIGSLPDSAKQAIISIADQGIMIGGVSGNFYPSENTTRTQMVITLVRLLGLDTSIKPSKATFKDVPLTYWASGYIEAAYRSGIIKLGLNGNFGVNEECTREQMAIMFVRALGITDDQLVVNQDLSRIATLNDEDKISSWAKDSVEFVMNAGLMNGTGNSAFSPRGLAKREQVAQTLYRFTQNRENIEQQAASLAAPVQHPELYQALMNSLKGYKGEFDSKLNVSFTGPNTSDSLQIDTTMAGKINSPDSSISTRMITSSGDIVLDDSKYDFITIGNTVYIKLPDSSEWYKMTPEELDASGMSSLEYNDTMSQYSDFIRGYNKMPVVKTANVTMNGLNTTKYSITLDTGKFGSLLNSIMPPELLVGTGEGTVGTPSLNMEIYLDDQNRIAADKFSFTAKITADNPADELNIGITAESSYRNIGADIKITPPDSSLIVE